MKNQAGKTWIFDGPDPATNTLLEALAERNHAGLRELMADGATLIYEGASYPVDELEGWLNRCLPGGQVNLLHVKNAAVHGMTRILSVIVSTGDLQSSNETMAIQMNLRITVKEGGILAIEVNSQRTVRLPGVILSFVRAVNASRLDLLLATFAEDAFVNDQLRDYWGKAAISEWAAREIVGDRIRMMVIGILAHYSSVIVTANIDGNFDKRGLPDPLVLAFYFSANADKIVQLIILRNMID